MNKKAEVRAVWKKRGTTMGQLLEGFFRENPTLSDLPVTYAGRLDPMAEGVVLLLLGDSRFEKETFLSLGKTYTFECLWGMRTDTFDILGKVVESSKMEPKEEHIELCVRKISHMTEQNYPPFSSKPIKGKPLFWWAREGKLSEIAIPKRSIAIESLETTGSRNVSSSQLLDEIKSSLALVSGDFRQEKILSLWQKTLTEESSFLITSMRARVSSGTYIRGLVESLGESLGVGAVTLNIVRTHIGEYGKEAEK